MFSSIWPSKLKTPFFELGSPFEEGVQALTKLGEIKHKNDNTLGRGVRVDTKKYSVAIHERNGRIHSVWYSDPSGRRTQAGIGRKIGLYLKRYTVNGTWEVTHDNGHSIWWLNEVDQRLFDYGLHCDVILIVDRRTFDSD